MQIMITRNKIMGKEKIHVDKIDHGTPLWRDCTVKVVTCEITVSTTI
jgi:nitrous oxidase accessory protein NosD